MIDEIKKTLQDNLGLTPASFIAKHFDNKCIEVYTGENYDTIVVEQQTQNNPAVFCGKVLGSIGNFIVLDCFSEGKKQITSGNIVFINMEQVIILKEFELSSPITRTMIKSGSVTQNKLGDYEKGR